ncbi:MAG: hypothetical protein WED04_11985 [Promethearchaeati archaeon SRVP18_Atabeyarchaeia-1]
MSQKLGFPYMGLKINTLIFFFGIIFAVLAMLIYGLSLPPISIVLPGILLAFLRFIGLFLTGWALLGFAVMKEMHQKQRLIAFLFAVIVLASVFAVTVGFMWTVT